MVLPAQGTLTHTKDGKLELAFKITDAKSGSTATSTAIVSENGQQLRGKTTQYVFAERDGQRQSATLDYEWSAAKFVGGKK